MSTEELKHAGGYRIQKCKLTSSSGLVFPDFEKVVTGINIFENIFQANHIVDKWSVLINRWHNYLPFFKGLPFFETFKEVDAILKQIAPFFEQECKIESHLIGFNVKEKLHIVKQKLEIIGRQYA